MTKSRHKTGRRALTWGLAGLAAAALLALAMRQPPVLVDTAVVTRGDLRVVVSEEGETRVRERFLVSAPTPGRLLRIELEPGDPVVAGETVLATFEPRPSPLLDSRSRAEAEAGVQAAEATSRQARAEASRAEAERDFAATEARRLARLAAASVISQERLEEAEMTARSRGEAARAARFAVAAADYELVRARAVLSSGYAGTLGDRAGPPIEIRSPIDGTVLRRLRESEAIVPVGEPLIEVGDSQGLEIVSDLLSSDAVKVRPGQKVAIEQWGEDEPLAGIVRRVEPFARTKISALGVEEQRVDVVIDRVGESEAWTALGDGYRVEVGIVLWEEQDVLQIPTASLFRSGEGWAVWVVEGGRAVRRPVEIGRRSSLAAQVIAGLAPGEGVLVHPGDQVAEGVRVERRGS